MTEVPARADVADGAQTWDLDYRPQRLVRIALVVATVVLALHITFGLLLTISNTGAANIGVNDEIAIILIGVLLTGAVLLFTRPRLRVGPCGVAVRNLTGERRFDWESVRGLGYPARGFGARLLLPSDEHIPVLAVQAGDGERAVAVMRHYRELQERYAPATPTAD